MGRRFVPRQGGGQPDNCLHTRKCILLHAKDIYKDAVPDGEEAFLFQYSVSQLTADCKTAIIDFDEKCIVEKGDMFQNYPNLGDEDTFIQDYKIEMFPQVIIFLTTLTSEAALRLFGSLVATARCFRPFG